MAENAGAMGRVALTDEQVAEWERLAAQATLGPWGFRTDVVCPGTRREQWEARIEAADGVLAIRKFGPLGDINARDFRLIAAARTAVPALCADWRVLQAENARLRAMAEGTEQRTAAPQAQVDELLVRGVETERELAPLRCQLRERVKLAADGVERVIAENAELRRLLRQQVEAARTEGD